MSNAENTGEGITDFVPNQFRIGRGAKKTKVKCIKQDLKKSDKQIIKNLNSNSKTKRKERFQKIQRDSRASLRKVSPDVPQSTEGTQEVSENPEVVEVSATRVPHVEEVEEDIPEIEEDIDVVMHLWQKHIREESNAEQQKLKSMRIPNPKGALCQERFRTYRQQYPVFATLESSKGISRSFSFDADLTSKVRPDSGHGVAWHNREYTCHICGGHMMGAEYSVRIAAIPYYNYYHKICFEKSLEPDAVAASKKFLC